VVQQLLLVDKSPEEYSRYITRTCTLFRL